MPPHIRSLLALAGLGVGCGGAAPPSPTVPAIEPAAERCLLRSDAPGAHVSLLRAAADPGLRHLFDADRLRTPIGLDCEGVPRPRVAAAWAADTSRTAWTLTLAADAGGSAADLASAWRTGPAAAGVLNRAGVASVLPLDERRVVVTFRQPYDSVPLLFADPALALPREGAESSSIGLRYDPAADLRDAIDRGTDVVLTAAPAVLDYAESRPGLTLAPLPWSRTYVLLLPPGSAAGDIVGADSAGFRSALARDAVRVAARGAEPPFWWSRQRHCGRPPPRPTVPAAPAVIYPAADPVARALAERIVALSESPDLLARGVAGQEFPAALSAGGAQAFVVPLPRRALVPCRELSAWPEGVSVLPLIDTRLTAVLRDGTPPLRVEWDGALVPAEQP